ncbi:aspartyl/asparaginyl beta-hydroxylase domain-containing protein [Rhodospirillaceae bacterium SYSU D60014]|uniref:aspartyl/asparaginyl beta-hydroxylase domain-containing protein n=1 Tax=Virgifigura deserti TaxID=2268457 RepID=UPI000E6680CE
MAQGRGRAAIIWLGFHLHPWIDRLLSRYSRVGDPPVFDTALFPWAATLEANWEVIRAEADRILQARGAAPPLRRISPDHHRITTDDNWRAFFLWGYGVRSANNCRRCPETARLVEAIPGLQTALFSILLPGTHIPRHTGVTKAILTCHLGLRIPKNRERCRIRVAERDYNWREGELFVFDDIYDHEVWNDTEEERVVLIIHVKRPLRFPGSLVRDGLLTAIRKSPFIQDARRAIEQWESKPAE